MANARTILLMGLEPAAEGAAAAHLAQRDLGILKAGITAWETLKDPQIGGIFLQHSTGLLVADEIRKIHELRPEIPVILLSTAYSTDLVRSAWHAGAADALALPLSAEAMDAALLRISGESGAMADAAPQDVQARFRYLDESGSERWISVVPPRFTIGRSSANDLVLGQMSISRAHAEVLARDGEYMLRDLGSKHGTFLNGAKIDEAPLQNGDRVQLGGLQGQQLTFHKGDLLQSLLGSSQTKPDSPSLPVRGFREIGLLLETFRALSSIPLLDDLLALVVDTAIELTGAERGFIMLKEEEDVLSFRCARNRFKRPLDGSSFQTSRRVPDEVYRTGNRAVINDLDMGEGSEDHSSTRRLGLRSIFCVPLRYLTFHDTGNQSGVGRMETIGVLYVDSQSIGTGLSGTQIDALETLASEAAMAIYNARLYRDSQAKRKLDEQLAIAREIQQALLPQPSCTLPFVCAHSLNLSCYEVGGDYFDYFDIDGGRLGFALGDVAGKGIPASLLTSMVQGMFSSQAHQNLPIPLMLSNVNCNLAKRGTGNRFMTFFFGILDENGTCTYSNAGHNPPYLVRKDGSITELTEGGMVLGLFASAQYEAATVQFEPGDHLILFTDGVVEARNSAGDEYGEERLRSLLQQNCRTKSAQLLSLLQESIAVFSAKTPQHDDITMMVIGFKEE